MTINLAPIIKKSKTITHFGDISIQADDKTQIFDQPITFPGTSRNSKLNAAPDTT